MHQVLLKVGGFNVYTYSLLMAVAALGGLLVALQEGRRLGLRAVDVADGVIWTVIGAILGARLEYILLNWEYFEAEPGSSVRVWEGGFAYHGGILTGILVLVLYSRLRRLPFWSLSDALSLGYALSMAVGWAACLVGGFAYGRMGFGLLHFTWHDAYGVVASRFAVQPLGILLCLMLFAGLWVLRDRMPFPGAILLAFLMVSGVIQFGLGFGRADETVSWRGLRADQWFALGQVLLSVGAGVWRERTVSGRRLSGNRVGGGDC